MTFMTNSWEKLDSESPKAFQRFCSYRDMGIDRSLRKLANDLQINVSTLAELSKKYSWQTRIIDFDSYIERASQHSQIAQIRLMKRRQIALALRAQKAAAQGFKKLIREIESDKATLKPEGLAKLLDTGCRLERLNRDVPEQNLELKQESKIDTLSLEEGETFRILLSKIQGQA